MKKHLKKIADELMKLEMKLQNGNCDNNEQNIILEKMTDLSMGLSFEEMLEIDEYIQSKL